MCSCLSLFSCIQSSSQHDTSLRRAYSRYQSHRSTSARIRKESDSEGREKILIRGKEAKEKKKKREKESIRERSEKSQHIAVRSRESECVEEMICICAYKKRRERGGERERSPTQAFPIYSHKIWIVDSPTPLLPFHANSISAFCAWKSRPIYTNARDNSLSFSRF